MKTMRAGRPPLLCSFERPSCSRFRFEQLAPHVEERPTDEHGSPEQDESGNDGHRDRYAGKPRDEAHAFTTNITHGHGGLLKRQPAYLKAARQGKAPQDETRKHYLRCWLADVVVSGPGDETVGGVMGRILLVVVSVALSVLAGVRQVDAATRAEKCAVAKLKAANKKAAAKLRCHEKAVMEGKRVASNCLLAADDRFVVAFAKAELKGGCATTRDQAAVEDQVDRFVTGLLDTLTGGD